MPECYTHCHVATRALMRSGQLVASHPAFLAGANGPAPFMLYRPDKKQENFDLPALGSRMHHEKTGLFLNNLVRLAITPIQQSYALGYLSHYAADCVLDPYIHAMCIPPAGPYSMLRGSAWMRLSMDSTLYYQSYRTYLVPLHVATPVLVTEELAQVTSLLQGVLRQTYDIQLPLVVLADVYHNLLARRRGRISRYGVRKFFAGMGEVIRYGSKGRGKITSLMQPGRPLKPLPTAWSNPYTQEEKNKTFDEMIMEAIEAGAICISGAMRLWLAKITPEQLEVVLGDNDFHTGMPCAVPVEISE